MVEHSYWEEKVVSSVHMIWRFAGLHSEVVEDSFLLGYDTASCPRRRELSALPLRKPRTSNTFFEDSFLLGYDTASFQKKGILVQSG